MPLPQMTDYALTTNCFDILSRHVYEWARFRRVHQARYSAGLQGRISFGNPIGVQASGHALVSSQVGYSTSSAGAERLCLHFILSQFLMVR